MPGLITEHGSVSLEVAADMARAVRERLDTDLGIGITGIAGEPDIEGVPSGKVHFGLSHPNGSLSFTRKYQPQHLLVKQRASSEALFALLDIVRDFTQER